MIPCIARVLSIIKQIIMFMHSTEGDKKLEVFDSSKLYNKNPHPCGLFSGILCLKQ